MVKFLVTTTYYEMFWQRFYEQRPELSNLPYPVQLQEVLNQCFGTSDFFSFNLQKIGHESEEIIVNCTPLQQQWARENAPELNLQHAPDRIDRWQHAVLQAQIKAYRPDVLYIHDLNWTDEALLKAVRSDARLIVGQNASPIRTNIDYSAYDVILTSMPHYVSMFREGGAKSEYFQLAFEPRILERLGKTIEKIPVSFVGGYSMHHRSGTQILEQIAPHLPISFWGYGGYSLPPNSAIRQRYRGEAWALDMFRVLAESKMTLNRHIDVARQYANNMRLYEATGVGSCLVTDMKDNLHQLFEVDREVVAYRSPEECIEKVRYLLESEQERAAIARAGQARILREHTYWHRMQELVDIVRRYLPEPFSPRFPDPGIAKVPAPSPPTTEQRIAKTMFWDDIKLVTEQIEKYGLRKPFVDLGGLDRPVIADYDLTLHTGDQQARFVSLSQRPFEHIDRDYLVINPEQGDPFIEDLPQKYSNAFGTVVCLSVLEHVGNPFEVFQALYQIVKPNSLIVLSTVFSYPYHPSPNDYWRYTPACLRHLSESTGFRVLECDWRLIIPADKGIRAVQDGTLLEVKSVYATLTKGEFQASPSSMRYSLPQRTSRNPQANQLIGQELQKVQGSTSMPSPGDRPVVLVYSDASGNSSLTQNAHRVLEGLARTGQTVIYVRPQSETTVSTRSDIQYRDLSYDPNADFSKAFSNQNEVRSIVSELRPSLAVFVDSCPVSNFAAKQIIAGSNIPSIYIVGSAVPQVAENFAPCLPEVTARYNQSRGVIVFSQQTLQNLQQYFGLSSGKGKVIQGGVPVPEYLPAIAMKSPTPSPTPATAVPQNRPQWEYLPQGWKTQDPNILGWNVQSILDTQRQKWPAFVRSLQGTNPLGINHESPTISGSDYASHNTLMVYGYVLAKAAYQKDRISILDWGGGLGHYYLISKALLPDVAIDYYCKDLPILCQGGRELLPDVTFYDDESDCFQKSYDLVLSSSSLQYSEDWKDTVRKLADSARSYLLITRLPIVHNADSFVVVQRPYAYGYYTEYITWFLNRQSLLEYIIGLGMKFVREFLIAEKFPVPDAPEVAEARGFLFAKP